MKKLIFFSLILFSTSVMYAQVYFRFSTGYALPMATETVGEKELEESTAIGNTFEYAHTTEAVKASYGAGLNLNLGAGMMFSKHFGAELNVNYLAGKKIETSNIRRYHYDAGDFKDEFITTTKSKSLFINPSFIITTGLGTRVPYGRFGVVVGLPKLGVEESAYGDTDGTYSYSSKSEYKKGISLGFQGAVGMNWVLNNYIDLVTEFNFTSMTYYPQELVVTELVYNGQKQDMGQVSEYNKKTEFKKKIDIEGEPDGTKPRQALREGKPFSSVSFQVGVVYILGGRSLEE